jgi:SAM-dependent methyltransferase
MTNEWTNPEHAEAYLARMKDIPHRVEGESTLLSEIPTETKRVLDLGCGDGHLLSLVLDHCPGASGVGLDLSPTMLEQAHLRFEGQDRVTLVPQVVVVRPPERKSVQFAVILPSVPSRWTVAGWCLTAPDGRCSSIGTVSRIFC